MSKMSAVFKISKMILILIFISLATLVTGTCNDYGHACWGAHGKRSGDKNIFLHKLLSSIIRETDESKLLKYPTIKESSNLEQWIPVWIHPYDKERKTRRLNQNGDNLNEPFNFDSPADNNEIFDYVPIVKEKPYFSENIYSPPRSLKTRSILNDAHEKVPRF